MTVGIATAHKLDRVSALMGRAAPASRRGGVFLVRVVRESILWPVSLDD